MYVCHIPVAVCTADAQHGRRGCARPSSTCHPRSSGSSCTSLTPVCQQTPSIAEFGYKRIVYKHTAISSNQLIICVWCSLCSSTQWQCFGKHWRHIYFGSHNRISSSSLFVVILTMVVPAVTYFGHLRNCYVHGNVHGTRGVQKVLQLDTLSNKLIIFLLLIE